MQVSSTRKDGSALSGPDLKHLRLYRQGSTDTAGTVIATVDQPTGGFPATVTYVDTTIVPGQSYDCWYTEVDENGNEGDQSNHWPLVVPLAESAPAGGSLTIALS